VGRLWVVDSGQTAPYSHPKRNCPPKLIVFDLGAGNAELVRHVLPHNRQSLFKQIVLDLSLGLKDTFAYISDFASGRILAFSLRSGLSWSLQTEETEPSNNEFAIGRYSQFYLRTGVWGLALLGGRELLVGSRLGKDIFTSSTYMMKSPGKNGVEEQSMLRKPSPAGCLTSSSEDELFLISIPSPTIHSFNYSQGGSEGWVEECSLPPIHSWPDSLFIDSQGYIWIVSNRFHDFTRDNLRLSKEPIFTVIRLRLGGHARRSYMTRFVQYSSAQGVARTHLEMIFVSTFVLSLLAR